MVSKRHEHFMGLVVFFLIIFGFSTMSMGGNIFPSFTFVDPLDGTTVTSDTFLDQPTLLVFLENAGELTESNIRMVTRIKEKYSEYDLRVAAICIDRDEAGVLRMLVKQQPSFKVLVPKEGWRIEAGGSGMPLFLLLDNNLAVIRKLERKEEAKKALFEAIDMQLGIMR